MWHAGPETGAFGTPRVLVSTGALKPVDGSPSTGKTEQSLPETARISYEDDCLAMPIYRRPAFGGVESLWAVRANTRPAPGTGRHRTGLMLGRSLSLCYAS